MGVRTVTERRIGWLAVLAPGHCRARRVDGAVHSLSPGHESQMIALYHTTHGGDGRETYGLPDLTT